MRRSCRKALLIGLLFLISLLIHPAVLLAEEQVKEKESKFEEIVVTATKTEKELEGAPGSVSVVTKKDIEKRNIKTVDEALNTVPGVFNRRGKGIMDTLANISLRGFPGQDRTLILMDGVALNSAYTGAVQWGGLLPEDVERIEVVRGPFSSLYGGYAMGGVVNILTKMPEKREFTLKSGYGTAWDKGDAMDDLWRVYLSYGDKIKDRLSLFLSYGYKATDGYPTDFNVQSARPPAGITGWELTTNNEGAIRYLIGHRGDNSWWDDNMTLKAGYDFSKVTKVTLSFLRARQEYEYDDPKTYLRNAAGNEVWSYGTVGQRTFVSGSGAREQNYYNIGFETEIYSAKAKLSLGLVDQRKSWYTTPGTTAATTRFGGPGSVSNSPSKNYQADLQFSIPLFKRHLLTVGGSYKHGESETEEHRLSNWKDEKSRTALTYLSSGKDRTYAIFVQGEIMILNDLTAYLGFRQDWWETYDGYVNQIGTAGYPRIYGERDHSSFSPKVALVYKPFEVTTLRASAGKAFRAPNIYDLYRTWTSAAGTTFAANPDLKPETTRSWDIGIEQKLWQGAKVGVTYFENYMKDLIYRKTVTPTYREFINAGEAESKGIELEAEQRFGKWLRLFANFTYTSAQLKENEASPATVGRRLTQVPKTMFNIGGDFEQGPFATSLVGRYVSKRYSTDDNRDKVNHVYTSYDPYFIVDAKLSYKFLKFATASLSVDNIFDKDYYAYYKAPGRSWFAELSMRF